MEKTVYIPNRSAHDFTDAFRYGDPCYLTEGIINRYGINELYLELVEKLQDARATDYLIMASLPIVTNIATGLLAFRFHRVNYLIFRKGAYIVRTVNYNTSEIVHPREILDEQELENIRSNREEGGIRRDPSHAAFIPQGGDRLPTVGM